MKKYLSIIIILSISILKGQTLAFGEDISKYQIDENIKVQSLYDSESKFNTKFKASVTDVCQVKGCWMKLDIGNDREVMVNFKDYGFFVPKDIVGKNVLVNGEAYKRTISIGELKHYAQDRGDSKEVINSITRPEEIFSLTANGVEILSQE
tara:strand:- start:2301 stop:2753 length:453 start_codon:yes stop_codon:yes gene_type:complete